MKKLLLILAVSFLLPQTVFAGSAIMKGPKPASTLIQDNPTWTGQTYSGFPIKYGSDAIGLNLNYITQVVTIQEKNGTTTLQVYSRGMASEGFTNAKANSTAVNDPIGIPSITFQDSGIVMPRSTYSYSTFTEVTLNWSWQIISVFKLTSAEAANFMTQFNTWKVGKLPLTAGGGNGNVTYYYKQQ